MTGCLRFVASRLWFILLVCGSLLVACGVSIVLKDSTSQGTATDVSRLPLSPPPTLLLLQLSFQDPVLPIAPAAFAIILFIAAAAAPLC